MKTTIFCLTMMLGLIISPAIAQKMNGYDANTNAAFQPVKANHPDVPSVQNSAMLKLSNNSANAAISGFQFTKSNLITKSYLKNQKENLGPANIKKGITQKKRNYSMK